MNVVLDKIYAARDREARERVEWEAEQAARDERFQRWFALAQDLFIHRLRQGTPRSYALWLEGYLENGGDVTHWYNYAMPCDRLYVLPEDCRAEVWPLYGAQAVSVIIKQGASVAFRPVANMRDPDIGHNHLYFMDGYREFGGFVPCYPDVLRILEDGR